MTCPQILPPTLRRFESPRADGALQLLGHQAPAQAPTSRIGHGHGRDESLGIGVLRIAEDCVPRADLLDGGTDAAARLAELTGEPLPDGEMGELVFTTLTKEGLPMVRYRTRDLTRLLPGTARSMRRIAPSGVCAQAVTFTSSES